MWRECSSKEVEKMNSQQLAVAIDLFEMKIEQLEGQYKEKHTDDFQHSKMRRYVNRKLQKEMDILIACNLLPAAKIVKTNERFKY